MPRRSTSLATLIVGLSLALGGCERDRPRASATLSPVRTPFIGASRTVTLPPGPPCRYPAKIAMPAWVPKDLPLPEGTYAYRSLPDLSGYHRALFTFRIDTAEFARFVLREWPKSGWTLGRGDSELGEVEDQFSRPPAVGAFRATDHFCQPGRTDMFMLYSEAPQRLVPTPSHNAPGPTTPFGSSPTG